MDCWSVVESILALCSFSACALIEVASAMALTSFSLLSEGDSDLVESEVELRFSVVRDAELTPVEVERRMMLYMTSVFQSNHKFAWEAKDAELSL